MNKMQEIFDLISDERDKQDALWGIQNHPDFCPILTNRSGGCSIYRMAEEFEVPSPERARSITHMANARRELSWFPILQEEVSEVLQWNGLTKKDELKRELIQVAAVAVAWIESLERREL